jgi:hypothetical protein
MYPESFKSEPSKKTPWVIMEPGKIFIMGRSISENPGEFYRPILDWISGYAHIHSDKTKIDFGFEYVNTSSTKWIYIILKELAEMKGMVTNISFTWYYEQGDEDMYELGFIMKSLVECSFTIVEVDEMNITVFEKILSGNNKL